ncbi:MAG: zinc dependent phospholipase C family protein [Erysipelotrichaceae bacterium]|nr:zinc dependent phospholipase C family protein [Erysipelotrichaceae bacterium]
MPTTYTHNKFGSLCIEVMPPEYKTIVEKYRELFDIGVHGPDFFFYNLKEPEVSAYGYDMHYAPARSFFERCRIVYKTHEEKEAILAYSLGFLTHFALDSTCHSYVYAKQNASNLTHSKVEAEFDRYLIVQEGKKPYKVRLGKLINPSKNNAKIISYFFPHSEETIHKTLKYMRLFVTILSPSNKLNKKIILGICKITKNDYYADMIMGDKEDEACKDSNLRLEKLMYKAQELYSKLLSSFIGYIKNNKELIDYFDRTYDKQKDYYKIPVLSYDEEINYKV